MLLAVISNVDELLSKYQTKQRQLKLPRARKAGTSIKKPDKEAKSSLYSVCY